MTQPTIDQLRELLAPIETAHKEALKLLETACAQLSEFKNNDNTSRLADALHKLDCKQAEIDDCKQELAKVKQERDDAILERNEAREEVKGGGWTWDHRDEVWRCCGCHGEDCECDEHEVLWCEHPGEEESAMSASGEGMTDGSFVSDEDEDLE